MSLPIPSALCLLVWIGSKHVWAVLRSTRAVDEKDDKRKNKEDSYNSVAKIYYSIKKCCKWTQVDAKTVEGDIYIQLMVWGNNCPTTR